MNKLEESLGLFNLPSNLCSIVIITLGYVFSGIIAWWIASPTGLVGRALESFFTLFGLISDKRVLESCSFLYAFFAYALTPANSIVGVALGTAGYTHGGMNSDPLFKTPAYSYLPRRYTFQIPVTPSSS